MKMSRYLEQHKWHIIALFILIIIAGISWNYKNEDLRFKIALPADRQEDSKENTTTTTGSINKSKILNLKSKIINDNTADTTIIVNGEKYSSNLTTTTTVYQLMQNLSVSSIKPFSFKTKEYPGMGQFVEEINGLKNNPQTGEYWIYYINGESAKVGISDYITNQKDLIEWKYDKTQI